MVATDQQLIGRQLPKNCNSELKHINEWDNKTLKIESKLNTELNINDTCWRSEMSSIKKYIYSVNKLLINELIM